MTTSTFVVPERTRSRLAFRESLGRWDVRFSPYLFVSPFFILFALVGLRCCTRVGSPSTSGIF